MTKRKIREKEENRKTVNESLIKQLGTFHSESGKYDILKQYFERNAIITVAIYGGGGQLGREFVEVCKQSHIKVSYAIDKFVSGEIDGIPIYQFRNEFLPEVDAVIIVPCHEKEFIKFEIRNYFTDACRLIGLDECISGVEEMQNEA